MIPSQIAFALGACGGLARILMPSAATTASNELVNWPARSLSRNLTGVARWRRSIRKLRVGCVVHTPSGLAVISARWDAAGAVFDDDQGEAPQEHGGHVTKSTARMPRACAVRNCFQVGPYGAARGRSRRRARSARP